MPEKSGLHKCGQADRVIALESWEGLGPQDAFIHARGEGERVLALESREGTRASRRLDRESLPGSLVAERGRETGSR